MRDAWNGVTRAEDVAELAGENGGWALATAVLAASPRTALLFGPPGTGKSYAARATAGNRPVFAITMTEETDASSLTGSWAPSAGSWAWLEGPAMAAWRTGGRLIIEEVDKATDIAGAVSMLHAILDSPRTARVTLPIKVRVTCQERECMEAGAHRGPECWEPAHSPEDPMATLATIRPAPGFDAVATMNGVPADLTDPVRDRFAAILPILRPNPVAVEAVTERLRPLAASGRISLRPCLSFMELVAAGLDEEVALRAAFGPAAQSIADSLALAPSRPSESERTVRAGSGLTVKAFGRDWDRDLVSRIRDGDCCCEDISCACHTWPLCECRDCKTAARELGTAVDEWTEYYRRYRRRPGVCDEVTCLDCKEAAWEAWINGEDEEEDEIG